jgi:type IV pilus biogenesis protein CpaD/CtpE
VWARHNVSTSQCPKSIISAESLTFLEEFNVWKRFGCGDARRMNARVADAIALLEDEWRRELERSASG